MSAPQHIVETEYASPATLADLERFCELARKHGASDEDEITTHPFRMRIRGLRVVADLARNREQAHRRDTGS